MLTRKLFALLVSFVLLLTTALPLWAGGWVVVTLDELPRQLHAGEALTLRFTIRQHGQTLINLSGPGPLLEAHHAETGAQIAVVGAREGFTGHYRADVIFPTAGMWEWQIVPRPFPAGAAMPPLVVQAAAVAEPVAEEPAQSDIADKTGLDLGEHLLLQWIAFVTDWFAQSAPAQAATVESTVGTPTAAETLAAYGQDLFLAKGCTACHLHGAIAVAWSTESGPTLTDYDKTATYLQLWLADPAAVKPTTQMPNLELDAAEIDALAAFLTANK
ncbi:MAG: c-type cytochrome [Caldilineaceae bacterium]|nr:c-type cytochrome [Caldilineaceae bacterium]